MSTSEFSEHEAQESDELVAYLDGELPPDDSRRVEERLASDDDYRLQLQELDRAWEALDSLPKATANEDFARTTIEMVAVHAQRDLSQQEVKVAQANRWQRLRWVAAGFVVAIISYAVASSLLPNRDEQLLADLPVIRRIDFLRPISDIDFLRELSKRVTVAQLTRDEQAQNRELKALEASSAPREQRKIWAQSLTPDEQQNLFAQQARYYEDISENERERLKKLAAEIAQAPDRKELEETLVAYHRWLNYQTENVRTTLRDGDLSSSQRVQEVANRVGNFRQLSKDEETNLREEIREIAAEKKADFRKFIAERPAPPEDEPLRTALLKYIDGQGAPAAIEYLTIYWALFFNNDTAQSTRERLEQRLDPQTVAFLKSGQGGNRRGRGGRGDPLLAWSLDSMQSLRRNYNTAELQEFLSESLSRETIRRIAEYPSVEFEAEVKRLKQEHDIQVSDFERFMGIRRGGRGGGGGPNQGFPPPPGGPRGLEKMEPPPREGKGGQREGRGGGNQNGNRPDRDDREDRRDRDNEDNKRDSRRNDRQPL